MEFEARVFPPLVPSEDDYDSEESDEEDHGELKAHPLVVSRILGLPELADRMHNHALYCRLLVERLSQSDRYVPLCTQSTLLRRLL